jgi:hypothetical protein
MTLTITRDAGPSATGNISITESAAKRANMSFNPSSDPAIDRIKTLAAALYTEIDIVAIGAIGLADEEDRIHARREAATAATQLQSAAMFAVQAIARAF